MSGEIPILKRDGSEAAYPYIGEDTNNDGYVDKQPVKLYAKYGDNMVPVQSDENGKLRVIADEVTLDAGEITVPAQSELYGLPAGADPAQPENWIPLELDENATGEGNLIVKLKAGDNDLFGENNPGYMKQDGSIVPKTYSNKTVPANDSIVIDENIDISNFEKFIAGFGSGATFSDAFEENDVYFEYTTTIEEDRFHASTEPIIHATEIEWLETGERRGQITKGEYDCHGNYIQIKLINDSDEELEVNSFWLGFK